MPRTEFINDPIDVSYIKSSLVLLAVTHPLLKVKFHVPTHKHTFVSSLFISSDMFFGSYLLLYIKYHTSGERSISRLRLLTEPKFDLASIEIK